MKAEQQKQAESLYFQTDLSKSEIAKMIGVSRRSLHYWVRQHNWDVIRESARVMPAALAGNCYFIMARLQENILSPERADKPVTLQEVNAMHRLIMTVSKLKDRGTLNENIEMMTYFMEFVHRQNPAMAEQLKPIVNDYLCHRAADQSMPPAVQAPPKQTNTEELLDLEDMATWGADPATGAAPVTPAAATPTIPRPAAPANIHSNEKPVITKPATPNQNPSATDIVQAPKAQHINRAARRRLARAAA